MNGHKTDTTNNGDGATVQTGFDSQRPQSQTTNETPEEKAKRLGVTLIPKYPMSPMPRNDGVIAVCGECGFRTLSRYGILLPTVQLPDWFRRLDMSERVNVIVTHEHVNLLRHGQLTKSGKNILCDTADAYVDLCESLKYAKDMYEVGEIIK